jgi:hypothetical protein
MLRMTRLIAVFGASPGIGKTTLTRQLASDAERLGRVDRFNEEDILTRSEFALVASQFRATGIVDLDVLLAASERFVASSMAYDVVVTDTLFPFVPSLVAWGHDEDTIRAFLVRLGTILEPISPIVVYLDGDPGDALPRAASRSGQAWMENFLAKTSTYKVTPPVRGLEGTIGHLRRERDITLRSMIDAGYTVVTIRDAHIRSADDLASEARSNIDLIA